MGFSIDYQLTIKGNVRSLHIAFYKGKKRIVSS